MKILVLNTEEIPWCPKCYEEMNGCPLETLKNENPCSCGMEKTELLVLKTLDEIKEIKE